MDEINSELSRTSNSDNERDKLLNTIEDKELKEALNRKRMDGRGRPRKNTTEGKRSDGYSRYTFIGNTEKMNKLKEIAFRNTLTQKEVFEEAITLFIEKYENEHGAIGVTPNNEK